MIREDKNQVFVNKGFNALNTKTFFGCQGEFDKMTDLMEECTVLVGYLYPWATRKMTQSLQSASLI